MKARMLSDEYVREIMNMVDDSATNPAEFYSSQVSDKTRLVSVL